ncbi:MAG: MBL fold metallo-hydrolase [Candidatus Cloacimonetes bacterium]|nr:MBL fold metallo-hydrolase [Candidatus Cloacimonadota bacterium]
MIKVKWFGHSMWKIWDDEISIITDPFTDIGYQMPENETADIVLCSHDHFDHNNISIIQGSPEVVDTEGEFDIHNIHIQTFPGWHDNSRGSQRGKNLLMKFTISGKSFLHCGDLGHILSEETIEKLGKIDVIFIPVGGFYTINAKTAQFIVGKIQPAIVFPMHYKTPVLDFPIAKKEEYLRLIEDYKQIDSNEIELTEDDFIKKQTIILNYK